MNVLKAAKIWLDYHKAHSKKNTVRAYESILFKFCQEFGDRSLGELSSDDILSFPNGITAGKKFSTKRIRYAHPPAFLNIHVDDRCYRAIQ